MTDLGEAAAAAVPQAVVPETDVADWVAYLQRPPGVFWIAGYPRSGLTLARSIMRHCFGWPTASIYDEEPMPISHRWATGAIGLGVDVDGLTVLATNGRRLPIKTHELPLPEDTTPTLVIFRDGRRTMDSLHAMYHDEGQPQHTMEEVIRGEHPWGNWSEWVAAWAKYENAIWLSYEQMVAELPLVVDLLARHFGMPPICRQVPAFADLHRASPKFFRRAAMTGRGSMTDEDEALFWELHGEAMQGLGYER